MAHQSLPRKDSHTLNQSTVTRCKRSRLLQGTDSNPPHQGRHLCINPWDSKFFGREGPSPLRADGSNETSLGPSEGLYVSSLSLSPCFPARTHLFSFFYFSFSSPLLLLNTIYQVFWKQLIWFYSCFLGIFCTFLGSISFIHRGLVSFGFLC